MSKWAVYVKGIYVGSVECGLEALLAALEAELGHRMVRVYDCCVEVL